MDRVSPEDGLRLCQGSAPNQSRGFVLCTTAAAGCCEGRGHDGLPAGQRSRLHQSPRLLESPTPGLTGPWAATLEAPGCGPSSGSCLISRNITRLIMGLICFQPSPELLHAAAIKHCQPLLLLLLPLSRHGAAFPSTGRHGFLDALCFLE